MGGFMTIDGRAFIGNTPVFHARVGDFVQWDVLALGDDHHTFHVHGHRWLEHGTPTDVKTIGPAESYRIRWREDRAGTWYYHCHVEAHMADGMIGLYRVARR
jgi:FtsP/CotA-like multicopper oxidase with cupredoxin domain